MAVRDRIKPYEENESMQFYVDQGMRKLGFMGKGQYDALKQVLEHRKTEDRERLNAELREIRLDEDFLEYEEYYVCKDNIRALDEEIQELENSLSDVKILTEQEEKEIKEQLCEEFIQKEEEKYQNARKVSVKEIAESFVKGSVLHTFGTANRGEFSSTPCELLNKGRFDIGDISAYRILLAYTSKDEWRGKICEIIDELLDQGSFLHALYALWCVCPEVNGELPENELWYEKLETWTQEMGKGVFKNSAGVLVGKAEYRMEGSGTYVWYDEDGDITKIAEWAADSEDIEDEDVLYETHSWVEFGR